MEALELAAKDAATGKLFPFSCIYLTSSAAFTKLRANSSSRHAEMNFLQTIFHGIFHFYQFDAAVVVGAVVLFSSGIDSGREMGLGVDGISPIAGRR